MPNSGCPGRIAPAIAADLAQSVATAFHLTVNGGDGGNAFVETVRKISR